MRTHLSAIALCCIVPGAALNAQQSTLYFNGNSGPQRSFIVQKDSKILTANGDWKGIERLKAYSTNHPGTYILFADANGLHRLDSAEKVAEAERLYEPMRELSAQQMALAAKQKPLAEQQAALGQQQAAAGQQMRGASTSEMSSVGHTQGVIGHEQGIIGHAQGDIGREQGVLGKQQGIIARHYYEQVQGFLDDCLQKHTCSTVPEKVS